MNNQSSKIWIHRTSDYKPNYGVIITLVLLNCILLATILSEPINYTRCLLHCVVVIVSFILFERIKYCINTKLSRRVKNE